MNSVRQAEEPLYRIARPWIALVLAAVLGGGLAVRPAAAGTISDIVVMIDSSGSIGNTYFQNELAFVEDLVLSVFGTPAETSIAIVRWGVLPRHSNTRSPTTRTAPR
ncbi:MAG: VWA domain-containing protein [bacterium]|nr:VWA domain-containing protein [bacterium]